MLSNGEIVLYPDKEGTLAYVRQDFGEKSEVPDGCIFRAGRRLLWMHDRAVPARILSFGTFSFDCGAKPDRWSQELRETEGTVCSQCGYPNGMEIASVSLIHPTRNIYALQKTFAGADGEVSFRYTLCGYDTDSDRAITHTETEKTECGAKIRFVMQGQDSYTGEVRVFSDRSVAVEVDGRTVTLRSEVNAGDTVAWYVALEDDLYGEDASAVNDENFRFVKENGFEGILSETKAHFAAYFQQGYVCTGNDLMDNVHRTALYHLKGCVTRWSIPVGLNNCAWDGKFFAFDEYYSFLGLIGAGHADLAKHVPSFRLNVCLEKAIHRAAQRGEEQARFVWETSEYGEELSPPGFWYDHVFHMAVVALGAYEYYLFTQDTDFLKKCYRMIRACAQFYTQHMLYTDRDGRVYVGKCTDLERLGSSVENPFMTACGVIRTLECVIGAADALDTDREYRDECARLAAELRKSLPKENGRYVPHLGCRDRSIAVFAGKFPFDVLASDDPYLLPAWRDFIEHEGEFGNMYQMGKKTSPWYAAWKAEGFARVGNAEEAYAALCQTFPSVGPFAEMFEINEPGILLRPWFTTAAGVYLSALQEMLLQSDGDSLFLLPAFPVQKEPVSFRLAAKGGAVVEATVVGEEITALRVEMRPGVAARTFTVYLRGKPCGEIVGTVSK